MNDIERFTRTIGQLYRLAKMNGYDVASFSDCLFSSETMKELEQGRSWELVYNPEKFFYSVEENSHWPPQISSIDDDILDYAAHFYVYWHELTGETFKKICSILPFASLESAYPLFHTRDEETNIWEAKKAQIERINPIRKSRLRLTAKDYQGQSDDCLFFLGRILLDKLYDDKRLRAATYRNHGFPYLANEKGGFYLSFARNTTSSSLTDTIASQAKLDEETRKQYSHKILIVFSLVNDQEKDVFETEYDMVLIIKDAPFVIVEKPNILTETFLPVNGFDIMKATTMERYKENESDAIESAIER